MGEPVYPFGAPSPTNFQNPGSMAVNELGQTNFNQALSKEFFENLGPQFRQATGMLLPFSLAEFVAQPQVWRNLLPMLQQKAQALPGNFFSNRSATDAYGGLTPGRKAMLHSAFQTSYAPNTARNDYLLAPDLFKQFLGSSQANDIVKSMLGQDTTSLRSQEDIRHALGLPRTPTFGEYTNEFNNLMTQYRQNNANYYGSPSKTAPIPFTPTIPTVTNTPPSTTTPTGAGPVLQPAPPDIPGPIANFDGALATPTGNGPAGSRTVNTLGPSVATPRAYERPSGISSRGGFSKLQGIMNQRASKGRQGTFQY